MIMAKGKDIFMLILILIGYIFNKQDFDNQANLKEKRLIYVFEL